LHKVASVNDLPPRDFVSIGYSSTASPTGILLLAVGPASPAPLGAAAMSFDFQKVSLGDFSGFVGSQTSDNATPPATAWTVLWRRDGLDFQVSGQDLTKDQILTAAASASPASSDEWEQLLRSQSATPVATASAGTSPPEVSTDSQPTFAGEPRDVAASVTVDDVSSNEEEWSGVLPTGESWTANISRVYDRMDIRYSIDGKLVETGFGTSTQPPTGTSVSCCNPIAVTNNPQAASLRVLRSNGDRYTIPLHEMPGTGGVRVALIAIPDGTLLAELIDTNGTVIESYAPH
jgi:hypothetical protein